LLPVLAYSTRYIALKIPKGPAINSARITIISVFIIAGIIETLVVVY
jgi:hypothetical protein